MRADMRVGMHVDVHLHGRAPVLPGERCAAVALAAGLLHGLLHAFGASLQ